MVKRKSGWFILLLLCSACSTLFAKPVSVEQVRKVADTFIKAENIRQEEKLKTLSKGPAQQAIPRKFTTAGVREIRGEDGKILAYITELVSEGFIITAADTDIRPVLGYSFKGKFPFQDSKHNVLLHLVQWDVKARLKALGSDTPEIQKLAQSNNETWATFTSGNDAFLQTTASSLSQWGPLIKTQWDQGGHYDDKCPLLQPGGSVRCAVGCVATAMAQIINYWAYPSSVSFSGWPWWLGGDSYTSKGDVGNIDIDDDATQRDFPTFSQLNSALSTLDYNGDAEEEAYLCFAAGVKLRMNYGSQSGIDTTRVAPALRNGFDYGSAKRKYRSGGLWSSYESKVIENIKKGWPVQIGLKNSSGSIGGHSVIVDGYKTTGEFHFYINYGWGGTNNTWYNPPSIRNYDVVAKIVFDICPYQGWNQWGADEKNSFGTVYTYPSEEPDLKWEVTAPFSRYTFDYAVVGTGNKIYVSLGPCDLGQGNCPYICVIDAYGDVNDMKKIPINDSDYDINYLTQNHRGEIFFGTSEYATKTSIYRVDPKTEAVTRIFDHTSPDRGIFDQPIKVDQKDYLYFVITPRFTSNSAKFYCMNRSGTVLWSHTFSPEMKFYRSVAAIDETRNQAYLNYYNDSLDKSYLVCFNKSLLGTMKWTHPFPGTHTASQMAGAPAIGEDGTIYIGCFTTLYALDPLTGNEKWHKDFYPAYAFNTPAIGRDGTLYVNYGKMISSTWHPLYIRALDPSDGTTNWEKEVASFVSEYDNMGDVYAAGNGMVGFTYKRDAGDVQHIGGLVDNGSSGTVLWDVEYGGEMVFGPGQTIYTVESTCTGTSSIYALSIGDRGDPDGLGMGYTDNAAPSMPSNPGPPDGTLEVNSTVNLSWDCTDPEAHTLKYSVFVGESGYDMVPLATDITESSYLLERLKPGTGYAWKVMATDGQAVSESPTWVFATHPPNPDLNGDKVVNFTDFAIVGKHWLDTDCNDPNWCEGADLDWSKDVGFPDLQILANNWLQPSTLYDWVTYNGHYYAATFVVGPWEDVQAEAFSIGANLVTINDSEENAWLTEHFGDRTRPGTAGIWIGLHKVGGEWAWVSGELITYESPWCTWCALYDTGSHAYLHTASHSEAGTWNNNIWHDTQQSHYLNGIIEVPW